MSSSVQSKDNRSVVRKIASKVKYGIKSFYDPVADLRPLWLFNAGNLFAGNPKWLFIYVNKYRKDIKAVWLCDYDETVEYINKLGYEAHNYNSDIAFAYEPKAMVYVVENVKESFPARLNPDAVILNLFHGVGCKSIERKVSCGFFMFENIAKKYIRHNLRFKNNQLFLVTSPLMEKHFKEQCGIDDDKVIRAGYPRCEYQKYFDKVQTYDHDILTQKGMPKDARIAVYAPTYRDASPFDMFGKAIPDMCALLEKLKENNTLLIFKMHPFMERDSVYVQVKEYYKDCPNFLFWDNSNDFYEIMDKIDLAIVDYSSIYYDLLAAGVKNFIRYIFDYGQENNNRDLVFDLLEMTSGKICKTYDELLESFGYENTKQDQKDTERINNLFWEYAGRDTFEKIISKTMEFTPEKRELPTLYSFDIFDTLISRKVLNPIGIFYYVKEKIEKSDAGFPAFLIKKYPKIRGEAEKNVRDYYIKTLNLREDGRREIYFDEIFDRIQSVYGITDEQKQILKDLELEAEYENSIPIPEKIGFVEELLERGDKVILISDMYLPKEFVRKLLYKANPILAELPLFLSSDYGVQKTTKLLYLEVYKSFEEYNFSKWRHFGDSQFADGKRPRQLGINAKVHGIPRFNDYETAMVEEIGTYDSFLVAAKLARFRDENTNIKDYYAYAHVSMYMVPYVSYAVKDAVKNGIKTLYFISRDGYHLKRIADAIIRAKGIDMKTKYIYGSRRAWRVPSFVTEIDKEFFTSFGNFAQVQSYDHLLEATCLDEETFQREFPELAYLKDVDRIDQRTLEDIKVVLSNSEKYKQYILDYAKNERKIINEYFNQEIDFSEKFAFVEYWGRGYTQDCHVRIMHTAAGKEIDVPYYYMRSIYSTEGASIKKNFTTHVQSLIFVEAIFANIPYKSIERYEYEGTKIVPVIEPIQCDEELNYSLERFLKQFCVDFYDSEVQYNDEETLERELFDFSFNYYAEHQEDDLIFSECLGPLVDSVGTYGDKREFAPPISKQMLEDLADGIPIGKLTYSLPITMIRSTEENIAKYERIMQQFEKENEEKRIEKQREKFDVREIEFKRQYEKYIWDKRIYNKKYKKICGKNPVIPKSVLIFDPYFIGNVIKPELYSLCNELSKIDGIKINYFVNKKSYSDENLKLFATSEVIILREQIDIISMLDIRPETKIVQMWQCALPTLSLGYMRNMDNMGSYEKKLIEVRESVNYSVVTTASEALSKMFVKSLKNTEPSNIVPIGNPCTDVYFDEKYKEQTRKTLYDKFPQARGKKIIVYIPRHRFRTEPYKKLEFLDVPLMYKYLKDEYVLVLHTPVKNDNKYHIANQQKDFVFDVKGIIALRPLLSIADVVVGDYRGSFFETPLLNVPIYATANDLQNHIENNDFKKNYNYMIGGPVVADTMDLIQRIIEIDQYDFTKQQKVVDRYLNKCDGRSAERLVKILFG